MWFSVGNVSFKKVVFYNCRYSLEIADGIGPTKSIVLRVGLMGNNANPEMVDLILIVLAESLEHTSTFRRKKIQK